VRRRTGVQHVSPGQAGFIEFHWQLVRRKCDDDRTAAERRTGNHAAVAAGTSRRPRFRVGCRSVLMRKTIDRLRQYCIASQVSCVRRVCVWLSDRCHGIVYAQRACTDPRRNTHGREEQAKQQLSRSGHGFKPRRF
jgi:hypothetical protein